MKKEKKREILDYFGGLVLDCITTVSGVQSVIAECSLYICVHYILQEKKNSRVTPPPLTETKCSNNAIDLVLILFNFISINNCCLPPKTDSFLLFRIQGVVTRSLQDVSEAQFCKLWKQIVNLREIKESERSIY